MASNRSKSILRQAIPLSRQYRERAAEILQERYSDYKDAKKAVDDWQALAGQTTYAEKEEIKTPRSGRAPLRNKPKPMKYVELICTSVLGCNWTCTIELQENAEYQVFFDDEDIIHTCKPGEVPPSEKRPHQHPKPLSSKKKRTNARPLLSNSREPISKRRKTLPNSAFDGGRASVSSRSDSSESENDEGLPRFTRSFSTADNIKPHRKIAAYSESASSGSASPIEPAPRRSTMPNLHTHTTSKKADKRKRSAVTSPSTHSESTPVKLPRTKRRRIPPSTSSSSATSDASECLSLRPRGKPATSLTSFCEPLRLDGEEYELFDLPDKDYDGSNESEDVQHDNHLLYVREPSTPLTDRHRKATPRSSSITPTNVPSPADSPVTSRNHKSIPDKVLQTARLQPSLVSQAAAYSDRQTPPCSPASTNRGVTVDSDVEASDEDEQPILEAANAKLQRTASSPLQAVPEIFLADEKYKLPRDLVDFLATAGIHTVSDFDSFGLGEEDMNTFLGSLFEKMAGMNAVDRRTEKLAGEAVRSCANSVTIHKVQGLFRLRKRP